MSEQLLTVLKLCLLALLYLFFLRVLRAVWTEVNPPRVAATPAAVPVGAASVKKGSGRKASPSAKAKTTTTKASKSAKSAMNRRKAPVVPTRLVLVEPAARAGAEYALGPELTLGRAAGCSIVLDEQYVSQVHSRIFIRDGSVFAEDLGSTNGTWVNGSRAVGQMPARLGDRIQVGN
ncbi:MAG: FHA domain-containing protein, partial [Microthrixaceae bacterium]